MEEDKEKETEKAEDKTTPDVCTDRCFLSLFSILKLAKAALIIVYTILSILIQSLLRKTSKPTWLSFNCFFWGVGGLFVDLYKIGYRPVFVTLFLMFLYLAADSDCYWLLFRGNCAGDKSCLRHSFLDVSSPCCRRRLERPHSFLRKLCWW